MRFANEWRVPRRERVHLAVICAQKKGVSDRVRSPLVNGPTRECERAHGFPTPKVWKCRAARSWTYCGQGSARENSFNGKGVVCANSDLSSGTTTSLINPLREGGGGASVRNKNGLDLHVQSSKRACTGVTVGRLTRDAGVSDLREREGRAWHAPPPE